LVVQPERTIAQADRSQVQLQVTAEFADGSQRDVTQLAHFEVSNFVATVSPAGLVTRVTSGESTVVVRYLNQQMGVPVVFVPPQTGGEWTAPRPMQVVDAQVQRKLQELGISAQPPVSDHLFVRRVYLDLLGRLPTSERTRRFVADARVDKRTRLIDELLARPEFAEQWALKWSDLLRNEEKLLDARGVEVFHNWIRDAFAQGMPLNQFVRQLLAAQGSTYEHPPANFYRAMRDPLTRGETAARVFLGVRLECARCHNHPFDQWTQDDYYGWANLFARIDYEIVENQRKDKFDKHEFVGDQRVVWKQEGDVTNPRTGQPAQTRFLSPGASPLGIEEERLEQAATWLTSDRNREFARAQANRIWFQLMGRGLVEPIDDFRITNPPSHPQLLDWLADSLTRHDYDVRHLIRIIADSQTYRAGGVADDQALLATENYAGVVPRRLTAEQLLDAQCQVLQVPTRFNGYAAGVRAGQLSGVQRVRPRDEAPSEDDRFLTLFGKPSRLMSCECERATDTTLSQAFYLINGPGLQDRLETPQNQLDRWIAAHNSDADVVQELFWAALSRPANAVESEAGVAAVQQAPSRIAGVRDLAWALLNSKEFLFRQ
jgi:hypothetical protein